MTDEYDVFICYSRRNSGFVKRLVSDLRENHIHVWLDTIELEVGDLVHYTIEQAIESSRYFCIVISAAAMQSYYVRKVEFETAFTRLAREHRDSFILPVMYQRVEELPTRLAGRHYLNFSSSRRYAENVRRLVKKIKLSSDTFTGARWFKAFEILPFGDIVGIGTQSQAAATGGSVCIHYQDGIVTKIDIYQNSRMVNYKRFTFDDQGRVHENMMYEPSSTGGWQYIDTWRYYYDPTTGRRLRKVIDKPGARSRQEIYYDGHNRQTEERIVTLDGPPDTSYGFTRKVFAYSQTGDVLSETWYGADGHEIPR